MDDFEWSIVSYNVCKHKQYGCCLFQGQIQRVINSSRTKKYCSITNKVIQQESSYSFLEYEHKLLTYWLRTCCKAFIISKYLLRISLWSLFKRSMYSFLWLTIVLGWRQTSIMPHLFINWIKIYACITLKQVRVSIRFIRIKIGNRGIS